MFGSQRLVDDGQAGRAIGRSDPEVNFFGKATFEYTVSDGHLTSTATVTVTMGGHGCATLDDGNTRCWGNNQRGQLGLGDTANRGSRPGEMGDGLPAVDW
ncbi:hypothetical protein LY474_19390 [Myxococcus stipitatus]|uniref:Ig-like domain-containing protein n=1 Tax=Myxococcus stipitatus TaxID=83455 RepID=UPI001F170CA9|nr:hypothetical protein [Myxococcus stipitatus]MCE9669967.1 hypothetical protein [Myxococcus stipitatus]